MKTVTSSVPNEQNRSVTLLGTLRMALVLVVVAALIGCKKEADSGDNTVQDTNQVPATAEQNHMPGSTKVASPSTTSVPPNGEPDLAEMNRNLLRWMMGNKRPPKNFEDFAATAGVPIPPPPAGKKYIIAKDMRIQLVNR